MKTVMSILPGDEILLDGWPAEYLCQDDDGTMHFKDLVSLNKLVLSFLKNLVIGMDGQHHTSPA